MRSCLKSLVLLLLLAGCGSSPKTRFYTLSAAPAGRGRRSISTPVQVSAVHVPPALDRRQMVRMNSANSADISETDQWSAPFDEMVRNVLAEDLVVRLAPSRVILPRAPAPPGTALLVVALTTFSPDAAGTVRLAGSWTLLSGSSGTATKRQNFDLIAGGASSADSTAAAMSEALARLADRIALGL